MLRWEVSLTLMHRMSLELNRVDGTHGWETFIYDLNIKGKPEWNSNTRE